MHGNARIIGQHRRNENSIESRGKTRTRLKYTFERF
jgi:hypothetical protein